MSLEWNFPSSLYGVVNGISDAGIETFNGSVYKSLAREICQNSMDARLDYTKIKKELNWKPKYSIEDGIDRTIKILKEENNN